MPKAFYLSKINLNITSRSIESGVPQRVWDILSVGGFCLTNYQPELEDYFEIGKDLDVYHNLEELDEKIAYYLKHDEERVRIAINGYKKMRKYHTTTERLKKALAYIYE
jgi:spore maturation protein CgeB